MRIPSGVTDQYIYFYAVDATDFTTPETGLSSFTVYRSRNGGAAATFTTPTINETDVTNMAGVYELLLDEDMTIDAGDDEQEMVFHISHAGMAPVVRSISLYRPKITAGNTLSAETDGDLTKVNTLHGHTAQTADHTASIAALVTGVPQIKYLGPVGPGVYIDSGSGNTNTVEGTDGTFDNPVSTPAAARTIADALGSNGVKVYYLVGNSDITLDATYEDWTFWGMGELTANVINLGSQDVDRSHFHNLTLEGTQGGTQRILATDCALQDPGVGVSTFHIFACRCGIVDDITLDTSNDNVFDACYSLVAGTSAPIFRASGASGTMSIRHFSGGVQLEDLSASHSVSIETDGQVIFAASCNVNATVVLRGNGTVTDNTAGMNNLTRDAYLNLSAINAEVDTALADYDGPTNAEMEARTMSALTRGTADSGSTTTLVDAALTQADTDYWEGQWLRMTGGANSGQSRLITGFNVAADRITVSRAFTQAVGVGDTYEILPAAAVGVDWGNLQRNTTANLLTGTRVGADLTHVMGGGLNQSTAGRFASNVDTLLDNSDADSILTLDDVATSGALATVKVVTDALTAAAALKLALSAGTMVPGTVDSTAFTPTTTVFEADDITEATTDHYVGRTILFTTGALANQQTDITDYFLSGSNGRFTVSELTEAPTNNDTFIIV